MGSVLWVYMREYLTLGTPFHPWLSSVYFCDLFWNFSKNICSLIKFPFLRCSIVENDNATSSVFLHIYAKWHCSLAKTAHSAKGYNKLTYFNGKGIILFTSICSSWEVPTKYSANENTYHFKYGPQNAIYSNKHFLPRNSCPYSTPINHFW